MLIAKNINSSAKLVILDAQNKTVRAQHNKSIPPRNTLDLQSINSSAHRIILGAEDQEVESVS